MLLRLLKFNEMSIGKSTSHANRPIIDMSTDGVNAERYRCVNACLCTNMAVVLDSPQNSPGKRDNRDNNNTNSSHDLFNQARLHLNDYFVGRLTRLSFKFSSLVRVHADKQQHTYAQTYYQLHFTCQVCRMTLCTVITKNFDNEERCKERTFVDDLSQRGTMVLANKKALYGDILRSAKHSSQYSDAFDLLIRGVDDILSITEEHMSPELAPLQQKLSSFLEASRIESEQRISKFIAEENESMSHTSRHARAELAALYQHVHGGTRTPSSSMSCSPHRVSSDSPLFSGRLSSISLTHSPIQQQLHSNVSRLHDLRPFQVSRSNSPAADSPLHNLPPPKILRSNDYVHSNDDAALFELEEHNEQEKQASFLYEDENDSDSELSLDMYRSVKENSYSVHSSSSKSYSTFADAQDFASSPHDLHQALPAYMDRATEGRKTIFEGVLQP